MNAKYANQIKSDLRTSRGSRLSFSNHSIPGLLKYEFFFGFVLIREIRG